MRSRSRCPMRGYDSPRPCLSGRAETLRVRWVAEAQGNPLEAKALGWAWSGSDLAACRPSMKCCATACPAPDNSSSRYQLGLIHSGGTARSSKSPVGADRPRKARSSNLGSSAEEPDLVGAGVPHLLGCAEGLDSVEAAQRVGVHQATVGKWRNLRMR